MAKRKWKGTLTKDLICVGRALVNKGPSLCEGDAVIVWKRRCYVDLNGDGKIEWDGTYEYHYTDENNKNLVRTTKFLLQEFDEPDL